MTKRWKGLAALLTAGALIVAPLVSAGAVADDAVPDDTAVVAVEPTAEPVAEPVADPPAEPVVADPPVVAEPVAEPEPAADPEPAVEPTEPATPPVEPPAPQGRVVDTPVQGYVLALWKADNGTEPWPQHLVGSVKTVNELLTALDHLAIDCGSFYQVDLYADDATTAALLAGGVLTSPNHPAESWPGGYYKSHYSHQWTTAPCPIEVTATYAYTPPSCDEAGSLWFDEVEGVSWGAVLNDDGTTTYTASADEGYVLSEPVSFTALNDLDQLDPTDPQCVQTYPLPAQFSADPEPAGCEVSGSFSTGFLGEPVTDDGEGTTTYVFENVDVTVIRTDAGVYLKVTAHPGYVLDALDEDKWDVSGDGLFAERNIVLDPATGFQSDDPEAPCFLAAPDETTLGQPTLEDPCGTANDFAFTPEDTASVDYGWASDDVTNFDIVAVVADGFTVVGDTAGWVDQGDGTWLYAWSPTFTDVACDGTPPDDGNPPAPPVKVTPGSLAATGSSTNYLPWGMGALAGILAGLSLIAGRKAFARR